MLKKIIKTQKKKIKDCLAGLTEEVASIKRELKRKRVQDGQPSPKFLPKEPLKEVEGFEAFEENLKNEGKFAELVKRLQGIPSRNAQAFIRNCWRTVICDSIATNYTWNGTKLKKSAKLCLTAAAIRSAFQGIYKEERLTVFEDTSRKHFQYAKDRLAKRAKYTPKEKSS